MIKEQGTPHLSQKSFQKIMNIVWLEGQLTGLSKAKENIHNKDEKYRFDILVHDVNKQLTELTGNRKPHEVMRNLF